MEITVLGVTEFKHGNAFELTGWETDGQGGSALAEFAGRACYQSWAKPNPATATNAGYLAHIIEIGHESVLEHGTVSLYFTGVSRAFSHELVRHRHFSYSQLSQRYVNSSDVEFISTNEIADDAEVRNLFVDAVEHSRRAYRLIAERLEVKIKQKHPSWTRTAIIKAARQAARLVLPNATETRIVVTGNYRAWRHFIALRATMHADVEIREAAVMTLTQLRDVAPGVFADLHVITLDDGTSAVERR